jgi:hypothetical protein
MSESENASMNADQTAVWDYIRDNPRILGLPLSEKKGIDLLTALRDVYETTNQNTEAGMLLLTVLANVLVAAAQGEGDEVIEEVTVIESMLDFDKEVRKVLDEGRK